MALVDYTIYRDNAAMSAVINTTTPLYGGGSLEISRPSAGQYLNMVRKNTPRNFASGRARFLLARSGGSLDDRYGFTFNQSQEDVTGGSGTAYWVFMNFAGATHALTLRRLTAGMANSTFIAGGSLFTPPDVPQSIPVEVTWIVDVATLGGIDITVKHGAVGNYAGSAINWATVLTTTDIHVLSTTTVLSTSQGEGPAVRCQGSGKYYLDEISVIPYLVGG